MISRVLWVVAALSLSLLGASVLVSRAAQPAIQTIPAGRGPDTVLLDPRTGTAFVASATAASVSVLDLAPLRVRRTVRVGDPSTLAPLALARDPTTHHLFVADRGDTPAPSVVLMLDSRSGARLAAVRVGHEASAVAVDTRRGHVLVANEADGTVSLLDARNGAVLRTTAVGLMPLAVTVDTRTARAFVIGPAVPDDPDLPARNGAVAGLLAVLDTRSGAFLRLIPLGSGVDTLAVDERSARLFVASGAGTLSALDAHDGTLLRTVTLGGVPATLAVDERRGRVFVVDARDGALSVLDATSGALLGTVRADATPNAAYPPPYALAIDEGRDLVYLTTWGPLTPVAGHGPTLAGAGTLVVLDARTGAVRRRIAVGVAPQAVAVDEDSGRVMVVNDGGAVVAHGAAWLTQGLHRLRGWLPWLSRVAPLPPAIVRVPGSISVLDGAAL